jgi:Amt family ammonium transporter
LRDVLADVVRQPLRELYMDSANEFPHLVPLLLTAGTVTLLQVAIAVGYVLLRDKVWLPRGVRPLAWRAADGVATTSSAPDVSNARPARSSSSGTGQFDLTRDEAVDALRAAEAKYRSFFENAIEGIFQTTPGGGYLSANPALARIYDYDSPQHLIDSIGNIERQLYVNPERRHEFIRAMAKDGVIANFESQIYRRDGSVIWISESARAVCDSHGNLEYYEGTVEDITERKQAEALFREKEAANRAKSQFLANMSHELRTPLNGVIGMLDLLLEASESPQSRRYASIAHSSANLLLSVINQILDFSKIEAGKLELETIEFSLRAVLEESLEMLAGKAAQKGLELALDMPAGMSTAVEGDPHRFRQVIVNLLGNAIKFTDRGHVRVRVGVLSETTERIIIFVAIEDTGIGVPADRLKQLFRSFSQVDASTTRQFGGTGLGLAISKQLVELMGGEIGVESAAGRGSSFWFRVPLLKPVQLAARPIVPPELRKLRVLVVDDNATNREILFRQLSAWQIRVETASSGASALELLGRVAAAGEQTDLAIVDCHMPGMDGYTLARHISAHESFRSMPLIMLTSMAAAADVEAGEVPIAARLTKPGRQSQLLDTILDTMAARRATRGSQSASLSPALVAKPSPPPLPARGSRRGRLLLAEDNEINRLVALEILGLAGFECDVAATGQAAIEAILKRAYDAVLMDCQMPVMDGLAATREIRRLEQEGPLAERCCRVPIVALTANAIQGDRELCEAAGMDHYLAKPLDSLKLMELLDVIIASADAVCVQEKTSESAPGLAPRQPDERCEAVRPANVPAFDFAELSERCLGNRELVERLVPKFVERLPAIARELDDAVRQGRLHEAAVQSHSLKGLAANLSAKPLHAAIRDLEAACAEHDSAGAALHLARARVEIDRCLDAAIQRAIVPLGTPEAARS